MLNLKKLLLFSTVLVLLLGFSTFIVNAEELRTGTVTATSLNLRSSASTSGSVLGTLYKGETLTILSTTNGWYNVKTASGKTGWVSSTYVSVNTAAAAAKTGTVTATSLNLRSTASTSSSILGTLTKGQTVTILSASNGWYNVKTAAGTTGWVSASYVSVNTTASRGDVTRTALGTEIVNYAKTFLGVPYVYGGMSPKGFDCSGFTKYVYDHFNISVERVSASQATQGTAVSKANLQPGDLVAFDTNGGLNAVNHVGIYMGNGSFIHASSGSSSMKVVISNLNTGFYLESYMGARRLF